MLQPNTPPEFLGAARQFRDRFAASDPATSAAIDRIVLPLRQRAERHPVPRVGMLAGCARDWRKQLPEHGRLSLKIDHERKSLAIEEVRISASNFGREDWQDLERGVSLLRLRLRIAPSTFDADIRPLASVSLHGLARRFQKGWRVDDLSIVADLCILAAAFRKVARADIGTDFQVRAVDGTWAGKIETVLTTNDRWRRILHTRTYLAEGETAR